MKKIIKNPILMFLLGAIIFGSIGPVLAYTLTASQVTYISPDASWHVSNVEDAVDQLYEKTLYGDATENDIISGKSAVVQGRRVDGTLTGFTPISTSENILPGTTSNNLNGYYSLTDYNVTCSRCTEQSYIPTDYDAKYTVSFTKSNTSATIKKITVVNGEEVEQTASSTLDDIKVTITQVGGGCGKTVVITNNGSNNISFGQKLYAPGSQIASVCSSSGNYSTGFMYISTYFNE